MESLDLLIKNVAVVRPEGITYNGCVGVAGGKIAFVGEAPPGMSAREEVDLKGYGYLLPGFVDLHLHGGDGYSAVLGKYDPDTEGFDGSDKNLRDALHAIASVHLFHGTTTMFAATSASEESILLRGLRVMGEVIEEGGLPSRVEGIYIEGTYLKMPEYAGAQNPEYFREPNVAHFETLQEAALGRVKIVNVVPEYGDAAVKMTEHLSSRGVTVAIGHSGADYHQTRACIEAGARLAVHFSNGPSATSFKPPGMVMEALLEDSRVTLELIADGHHINPPYLLSFLKAKNFVAALITDSMAPTGSYITRFVDSGKVGVLDPSGEVIRLEGSKTTLFGSVLTMDKAVTNVVRWLSKGMRGMYQGGPVIDPPPSTEEALRLVSMLASAYPARVVGLEDRGVIEKGKLADLVYLDGDLNVRQVWVGGVARLSPEDPFPPSE